MKSSTAAAVGLAAVVALLASRERKDGTFEFGDVTFEADRVLYYVDLDTQTFAGKQTRGSFKGKTLGGGIDVSGTFRC